MRAGLRDLLASASRAPGRGRAPGHLRGPAIPDLLQASPAGERPGDMGLPSPVEISLDPGLCHCVVRGLPVPLDLALWRRFWAVTVGWDRQSPPNVMDTGCLPGPGTTQPQSSPSAPREELQEHGDQAEAVRAQHLGGGARFGAAAGIAGSWAEHPVQRFARLPSHAGRGGVRRAARARAHDRRPRRRRRGAGARRQRPLHGPYRPAAADGVVERRRLRGPRHLRVPAAPRASRRRSRSARRAARRSSTRGASCSATRRTAGRSTPAT